MDDRLLLRQGRQDHLRRDDLLHRGRQRESRGQGGDTFGYDQANRLKTASVSGTSSSYVCDGDGKRTSKTVGSTQTNYTYDVNASLPVLLDDGIHKYVWRLGLAFAVDNSGNPLVYHTDGLGSVRALTDSSGSVVQTYQYDEYGNVVASSGSITQPFQYAGEQRDETGFMYLRARTYDPVIGRFLSRDDFGGFPAVPASLHRYAYAFNNPVVAVDPSGRCGIGSSPYLPVGAGLLLAESPAAAEAIAACLASPPCIIGVGIAVGGYYWWTHGGAEATECKL